MAWCVMRSLLAALLVGLCLSGAHGAGPPQVVGVRLAAAKGQPREHFDAWVRSFTKPYLEDAQEYERRFAVWLDNLEFILDYNSRHSGHWLDLNAFADLEHEEYKRHYLGYRPDPQLRASRSRTPFMYADVALDSLPKSVDWRKHNAVTKVKNQLQCGSCWAFSTTGSVEGINAIVTKELLSLSEQELVDCDVGRDHGCSGGLMDYAFNFILKNGGIDTEKDYSYIGHDGVCNPDKKNRKVVTIDGYEDVPVNDETALRKAVAHQPVSVAIEADQRAFQLYSGGVFDEECGEQLDHGVLVVGYGVVNVTGVNNGGTEYWIVKNSWGPGWGENGFIRLKRGHTSKAGLCGIAMVPSYPVKKGPNPPAPAPGPPSPSPDPKPQPVTCDNTYECPANSTCCCLRPLLGFCFGWGCCPMPKATCCDDHQHCCPASLPVCDSDVGRCLAREGQVEGSLPWSTKVPATLRRRTRAPGAPRKVDLADLLDEDQVVAVQ